MKKFEYKSDTDFIVNIMYSGSAYMNQRGEEGWELVTVLRDSSTLTFFWKREVNQDKP